MKKIYKYIGLLFGLLYGLHGYTQNQNQVSNGGFELGCTGPLGFSSEMYNFCGGSGTWPIESYDQGVFTISGSGNSVQSGWDGTPHSGSYYFVADGIWNSSCNDGRGPYSNNAWDADVLVYQGNTYVFSSWYRYEVPISGVPEGPITQLFSVAPQATSSANSPSNTSLTGTWYQQTSSYVTGGYSTNPQSVEIIIQEENNGYKCGISGDSYWLGNDYGLDDIYFGPICDEDGNPPPFYYQNTLNLPALTQATIIEAGYNILSMAGAVEGNVGVYYQNVTFTASEYIDLEPGFTADATSNGGYYFLADIGSVSGQCIVLPACTTDCEGGRMAIRPILTTSETTESGLKIYPNPTTGIVNITFSSTSSGQQNASIVVTNPLGEQVYNGTESFIGLKSVTTDLSPQPAGVYIVQVTYGSSVTTQKVVLAK